MKKYSIIIILAIIGTGAAAWYYYRANSVAPSRSITPVQTEEPKVLKIPTGTSSEISLSPLSICRALDKAVEFLNTSPDKITPVNEKQRSFLSADYMTYRRHMKKDMFGPDELKAYAARDAETLNKILRDNGFSIQLEPFSSPDSIGFLAIQDILVKWLEKAERKPIRSGKNEYAGFRLEAQSMAALESAHDAQVSFAVDDERNPTVVMAEIVTQSGDKVCCAVRIKITENNTEAVPFFSGKGVPSDHDVMHTIRSLVENRIQYSGTCRYNAIELPMISYQEQPDVAWFKKLQFPGYTVDQALQEVIFKMNESGARANAAFVFTIAGCTAGIPMPSPEPLIVNEPFLLWIERPGMPLPIFAAYLDQKYWTDPGSIE